MLGAEKLLKYISTLTDIAPLEWAQFVRQLQFKKLKKGELYFEQDVMTDNIGYVVSGLIQTYYISPEGKQRTKNFAWEGKLISPYAALVQGLPANFTAQAIEDTIILNLPYSVLKTFYKRHTCWEKMGRRAAENLLIERETREFQVLMLSNIERYQAFLKQYAPIIERIPQYMIASYLGITDVALSRLLNNSKGTTETTI